MFVSAHDCQLRTQTCPLVFVALHDLARHPKRGRPVAKTSHSVMPKRVARQRKGTNFATRQDKNLCAIGQYQGCLAASGEACAPKQTPGAVVEQTQLAPFDSDENDSLMDGELGAPHSDVCLPEPCSSYAIEPNYPSAKRNDQRV